MRRTIIAATATVLVMMTGTAQAELVRKQSPHSVAETIDRLAATVKAKGLTVFALIDHAAGAKKVDMDLRPTELIIFGSPKVGTPLMQAQQTMGLDLPLKVLAWQDEGGKVWLAYEAPADMAAAHGLPKDNPVIKKITGALDAFTSAAVKK
jgi:uncharacterized protein (DUF302 family)